MASIYETMLQRVQTPEPTYFEVQTELMQLDSESLRQRAIAQYALRREASLEASEEIASSKGYEQLARHIADLRERIRREHGTN